MEGSNSNFVELNWDELEDRLADLAKVQGEVRIWSKGQAPDLCHVINSHSDELEENTQQLRLRNKLYGNESLGKEFYIQFSLDSVEYFAKGKIVEILEGGEFWLEMNPHVFRVEKREGQRLVTFPKYQCYIYFKVTKEKNDNLVFLDKHVDRNHKIFGRFKQLTKKEFIKAQDSTDTISEEEVIGFRALDLSASGIAFLTNKNESLYFKAGDFFEVTICLEDFRCAISDAKVVYNVDYVNPRAKEVKMHKVGLTFSESNELNSLITKELAKGVHEYQILKDFENFSK